MKTLEIIEKVRELKSQIWDLEIDIRNAQSKCDHEYPEKPHFDSKYFYARCVKCGQERRIEHNIDTSADKWYLEDGFDVEKQNKWNEILKI